MCTIGVGGFVCCSRVTSIWCVFRRNWVRSAVRCVRPCDNLAGDFLSPDVSYSPVVAASRPSSGDRLV